MPRQQQHQETFGAAAICCQGKRCGLASLVLCVGSGHIHLLPASSGFEISRFAPAAAIVCVCMFAWSPTQRCSTMPCTPLLCPVSDLGPETGPSRAVRNEECDSRTTATAACLQAAAWLHNTQEMKAASQSMRSPAGPALKVFWGARGFASLYD